MMKMPGNYSNLHRRDDLKVGRTLVKPRGTKRPPPALARKKGEITRGKFVLRRFGKLCRQALTNLPSPSSPRRVNDGSTRIESAGPPHRRPDRLAALARRSYFPTSRPASTPRSGPR